MSSASNAHIRWPDRTRLAPCSTEASNQACFTISTISGESAGRAGVAGLHPVERAGEVGQQAGRLDLPSAQDRGEIGIGFIEQSDQEMFDLDIVVGAQGGRASRCLERAAAHVVQASDQWFQLYWAHVFVIPPGTSFPSDRRRTEFGQLSCNICPFDKKIQVFREGLRN